MSAIETSINIINAMGKPCPMPLLMLKRSLKNSNTKHFLLKSSDPHSLQDISRYCQIHHIHCEVLKIAENEFHYKIDV
ncbi:oxidoreductase [Acinetobacter sp. ANC 4558]|uniref:sulfurtransferase TusA family protein n=1 Tax=Acinetobacter sp. ANC 4558 TaxID=1977876 RepID=UPI000A34D4B1|nr:sulfurtransferase TusA family protein [Acinetobacter sp. ANC 4558]OTG85291.1 oxidoreductase [Acinetobacter sp. ANC 4558]